MSIKISLSLFLILALTLSACSAATQASANQGNQNPSQGSGNSGTPVPRGSRELPLAMQLAIGTFKLDKTTTPISAEQAAQLLPLWQGLRSLSSDQTAAVEEVQGLIEQIQEAMTPEQVTAIKNMKLKFQDIAQVAQEYNLQLGNFGNISPERRATFEAARQSGQFSGGGNGAPGQGGQGGGRLPGQGGPGFGGRLPGQDGPGGGFFNGEANGTQTTSNANAFRTAGINSAMIDAVINFLQSKTK
jgi:hypothetical protein